MDVYIGLLQHIVVCDFVSPFDAYDASEAFHVKRIQSPLLLEVETPNSLSHNIEQCSRHKTYIFYNIRILVRVVSTLLSQTLIANMKVVESMVVGKVASCGFHQFA